MECLGLAPSDSLRPRRRNLAIYLHRVEPDRRVLRSVQLVGGYSRGRLCLPHCGDFLAHRDFRIHRVKHDQQPGDAVGACSVPAARDPGLVRSGLQLPDGSQLVLLRLQRGQASATGTQ